MLEIDGASNRGIDEIRSLRANVGVRPSRSRFKIYIIDEVHMLTTQAFNALLKTLEEPPPHVKFIFCTTDPEKIPITVLSRCQRFDFSPVKPEEIMGRLREIVNAEKVEAEDEALRLIARRADGSMRDSQSLLEQVISFSSGAITAQTVHAMLGTADDARLHEMAETLMARDATKTLQLVDQAAAHGISAGQFAEQLLGYFRDMLAVTVGCPPEMQRHTSESLHHELRSLGNHWSVPTLLAIAGMIDQTLIKIRHTMHGRILLETTLIQICYLPDLQSLANLTGAIGSKPGGKIAAPVQPVVSANPAAPVEKKNIEPAPSISGARPVVASTSPAPVTKPAVTTAPAAPRVSPPIAVAPSPATTSSAAVTNRIDSAQRTAVAQPSAVAGPSATSQLNHRLAQTASTAVRTPTHAAQTNSASPATSTPVVAKTRLQRMREMESHEYIKNCLDMFGGEIIRIDSQ